MTEILRLEWGNNSVSFLGGDDGLYLRDYQIGIPQKKQQQSSVPIYGEGGSLIKSDIGDATDIVTFDVTGQTQDDAIANLEFILADAIRALENYQFYGSNEPVWIVRKADSETITGYAVVSEIIIDPKLPNIFARNFSLGTSEGPGLIGLQLSINRTPWWPQKTATQLAIGNSYRYKLNMYYQQVESTYIYGSIFKTQSGTLLAGTQISGPGTGHIMRSIDNGNTWSSVVSHANAQDCRFFQINNGHLIAQIWPASGVGNIVWYRSTDDGANWSSFKTSQENIGYILDDGAGRIYDAYIDSSSKSIKIRYSTDNLSTLNTLATIAEYSFVMCIAISGSTLILASNDSIWRSTDQGSTWTKVHHLTSHRILITCKIGDTWLAGCYYGMMISVDDGITWEFSYYAKVDFDQDSGAFCTSYFFENDKLFVNQFNASAGGIFSTVDGKNLDRAVFMYVSGSNGIQCAPSFEQGFVISAAGDVVFAALDKSIAKIRSVDSDGLVYHENSDPEIAFIGNFHSDANLLNSRYDDGGVYTLIPNVNDGASLFPTAPVANDALELRFFAGLLNKILSTCFVFDLSNSFGTVILEYKNYNGSFTSVDSFVDLTQRMSKHGIGSIFMLASSDLTTSDLYYVFRLNLFSVNNATNIPVQGNVSFYAISRSYIDLTHSPGSIPSLLKIEIENISGTETGDRRTDRVIVGSRSLSRGEDFVPFLPFSNVIHHNTLFMTTYHQNANMSWQYGLTYTLAYSSWSAQAANTSFTPLLRVLVSNKHATQYRGTFRVFVRGQVTSGSANDIAIRAGFAAGYNYSYTYTDYDSFKSITDWELLDLGIVSIPSGDSDGISQLKIQVEGKNSSGSIRTVNLYDVVLMPVDEWACDTFSINELGSFRDSVPLNEASAKKIVIDGTDPRSQVKTYIETNQGDVINSMIIAATGKPVVRGNDTRIWFLSASLTSDVWYSHAFVYGKIKASAIKRFAALSGGG